MGGFAETVDEQRAEEEAFLLGVQEGIADDIEFTKRGGIRAHWKGCSCDEILARLRRHQENVARAIKHVRDGGPLTDIVPIVWGEK